MSDQSLLLTIAILGGTGKEGKGLAYRWAKAGYRVLIGSRTPEKAKATATELKTLLATPTPDTSTLDPLTPRHPDTLDTSDTFFIEGMSNLDAAGKADIVALTVPYAAHRKTLEYVKPALQGKILVDVTVTLVLPKVTKVQMPPAGSAAQEARQILGEDVEVVAAFQNISHELLLSDNLVACDVLVCGTSKDARAEVLKLVAAAGLTGWDAGPIENSMAVEGLTSILIHINKQYGGTQAGIRITGASQNT